MKKADFLKRLEAPADDYQALRKMEEQKEKPFSWEALGEEGQLSVDVFESPTQIVIVAPVAGTRPSQLDITITGDTVTLRGSRSDECTDSDRTYFYRECYFGAFSRTVILPVHIAGDRADATLKNGVLTLRIPKVSSEAKVEIREIDE